MRLLSNQRGDTIVEVLIAVGIVTLVLAGAYALTARNTQISQEVQEQAYAQKLVEEQTELLRARGVNAGDTNKGCFGGDATGVSYYSEGDARCTVKNGGADFVLSVAQTAVANTYAVSATWDTLGGSKADVTVYYTAQ